jgi:hypothetical protein
MADTSTNFSDFSTHRNSSVQNVPVTAKASEGNLLGWTIYNPNSVDVYVKVFDATSSGVVSVGTTAPTISPLLIPATSQVVLENQGHSQFRFASGLHYFVVTGIADSSTANPTSPISLTFYIT